MDFIDKILISLIGAGSIIFGVSMNYLPSIGGNVPQGMDPDVFIKQQNKILLHSDAFVGTMVGVSIMVVSSATIVIKSCCETDSRILPLQS